MFEMHDEISLGQFAKVNLRTMTFRVLIDDAILSKYRDSFSRLTATMTPQDRAYFIYVHNNYSLMPKSASPMARSTWAAKADDNCAESRDAGPPTKRSS